MRNVPFCHVADGTHLGVILVNFNTASEEFVHLVRRLDGEVHTVLACELQLGINHLVGTVIFDKNFGLFKVRSGRKWGEDGS